jgi:hypothetical protein
MQGLIFLSLSLQSKTLHFGLIRDNSKLFENAAIAAEAFFVRLLK